VFNGLRINYIFCSCFKKNIFFWGYRYYYFLIWLICYFYLFFYYLIKIKLPYWNQPSLWFKLPVIFPALPEHNVLRKNNSPVSWRCDSQIYLFFLDIELIKGMLISRYFLSLLYREILIFLGGSPHYCPYIYTYIYQGLLTIVLIYIHIYTKVSSLLSFIYIYIYIYIYDRTARFIIYFFWKNMEVGGVFLLSSHLIYWHLSWFLNFVPLL